MGRAKRRGGDEMRLGDVWEGSRGTWLVTRVLWDGQTFGLVLRGDGPDREGSETRLSHDRFSSPGWKLLHEGSLLERVR